MTTVEGLGFGRAHRRTRRTCSACGLGLTGKRGHGFVTGGGVVHGTCLQPSDKKAKKEKGVRRFADPLPQPGGAARV